MLAVFGAFLGYQLSVVTRNYGLGVLLLVIGCIQFRERKRKPALLGLSLALLANTSVHAAIAAALILGIWLLDLLDRDGRNTLASQWGLAGVAVTAAGIIVAYLSARPSPDMVWASTLASLDLPTILRAILIDPGKGLMGYADANIAAAAEYPWRLVGVNATVASRVIVDAGLAWLLWSVRRNWKAVIALIVAILAFEIVFRALYTPGIWHEGLFLFVIFGICWITAGDEQAKASAVTRGLLPLFALQSLALPILVHRVIRYNESSSRAYGDFIHANTRYRDAILISEPDYFMEPMRYYVGNRIFSARQEEFANRVYFGERRARTLTLSQLQNAAEGVACSERVPVLLAIGTLDFQARSSGTRPVSYRATFTWTAAEKARLKEAAKRVAFFPRATTDEVYEVYEIDCRTPR